MVVRKTGITVVLVVLGMVFVTGRASAQLGGLMDKAKGAAESGAKGKVEKEVNDKLEVVMRKSFSDVLGLAQKHRTHMRTAAYVLGVGRVAEATRLRGLYG